MGEGQHLTTVDTRERGIRGGGEAAPRIRSSEHDGMRMEDRIDRRRDARPHEVALALSQPENVESRVRGACEGGALDHRLRDQPCLYRLPEFDERRPCQHVGRHGSRLAWDASPRQLIRSPTVSTWYSASFVCPRCASAGNAAFVRGAHVTRAPALREAALAGTLNTANCGGCGARLSADAEIIYTDVDRGQWIYVARDEDLPRWAEIESSAHRMFSTALASSPLAATLPHDRTRVVFGIAELQEKLLAWDGALDDRSLECVKLQCLRERPDLRCPGERIRMTTSDEAAISFTAGPRPDAPRIGWRVQRSRIREISGDPRWRAEFPELFDAMFVSLERYF